MFYSWSRGIYYVTVFSCDLLIENQESCLEYSVQQISKLLILFNPAVQKELFYSTVCKYKSECLYWIEVHLKICPVLGNVNVKFFDGHKW